MKTMRIRLLDNHGTAYFWSAYREKTTSGHFWMLRDHTGYIRACESRWVDSVPRIKAVAENHGLTISQSLS